MKRVVFAFIVTMLLGTSAFAQTYKTNLPANPTIVDLFLEAAKHETSEDCMVVQFAAKAVKNTKLRVTERIIDKKNGYLMICLGRNEDSSTTESCYWRMNNGKLLLAVAHIANVEMSTTLHFYEYDKATKTLKAIKKPFSLGLGNKAAEVTYDLPRYGKTIMAETYDLMSDNDEPYRWEITWNGSKFVVKHIQK